MTDELKTTENENGKPGVYRQGGSPEAVYGLGMIGACVYYIGGATTPEDRIKGFFKGLVWPAFLVYDLLQFLHKE
jgi:hypothetical protein